MMSVKGLLVKEIFQVLGIVLLVASIGFGFYIKDVLDVGTSKAGAIDRGYGYEPTSGGGCDALDDLLLEVTVAKRVMSENETQALTVSVANQDRTVTCEGDISLSAPELDVSPNILTRTLTIPPGKKINLIWILAPRKLGTFSLEVVFMDPKGAVVYKQIGITVTNVFGLTIWQAQLLSYVGGFLGTFFGPVLSFTWWYTVWRKHKRKKHARPSPASVQPTTQTPQGPIGKLLADKKQNTKSSVPDH